MSLFAENSILVSGSRFSAAQVIDLLGPQMTPERLKRMCEVIAERTYNVVPVLENIYDRGNVSAVMRSAEAFGFMNFHVVEQPQARFKAANRVTQGTDKWLDISRHQSTADCVATLRKKGIKIYATHLEASVPIDDIDFTEPSAIVLGNEKDGVSEEMLEASDARIILPMHGFAQSFNISVAGAISFYHIYQFRMAKLGKSGDLTKEQQQTILANYILRGLPRAESLLRELQGRASLYSV